MRGVCRYPGLVRGESCTVRVERLGPNVEFVGRMPPDELFERGLLGTVHEVGGKKSEGGYDVAVRLLDPWLELNMHPSLSRLFNAEPPSPFPYTVAPKHFLNGWTRAAELRVGSACHVWIKAEGNIPWLEREPDTLPSEFPGYPHEHLVGFWKARVTAIAVPSGGDARVRKVRAILLDDRIRDSKNPRVRELHGHEPWAEYSATVTNDELREAGNEAWGELGRKADNLLDRLAAIKLPGWLKGPSANRRPDPEDFDPV